MRELERKSQLLLKKAEIDAKRVSDGGDDNASGISAGKVSTKLSCLSTAFFCTSPSLLILLLVLHLFFLLVILLSSE